MSNSAEALRSDLTAAHAMILAERAARLAAEAERDQSRNCASQADALVAHLKLEIEKLKRALYGVRSESKQRLLGQLELQLEDAEAAATEDELAAERAAPSSVVASFEHRRPAHKLFPAHLPRERVVVAASCACPCCGSTKLSKLGEDVSETLEVIPRLWKVIQTHSGGEAQRMWWDSGPSALRAFSVRGSNWVPRAAAGIARPTRS